MTRQARHYEWEVILATRNYAHGSTFDHTYTIHGPATPAGAITKALVHAPRSIRENLHTAEIAAKRPLPLPTDQTLRPHVKHTDHPVL